MMNKFLLKSLAGSLLAMTAMVVNAGDYPSDKPIRMIVGYTTGGAADKLIRPVADRVSKIIGQQIIMDYKPGAGGAVALDLLARAPADGYTLHITDAGPMTILPGLRKTSYDPIKDFTPVAMLAGGGSVIVTLPNSPAKDIKTLIELAKKNPEAWSYGTSGVGGVAHLAAEQFKVATGLKIDHVPYKGGAPAVIELLGGHIPMLFSSLGSAATNIEAGRIKPLAVTSLNRSGLFPDVPTLAESGFPGFDSSIWYGIVGPAGLPKEVMDKLVPAFKQALADPAQQEAIRKEGYDTMPMTPEQMQKKIKDDIAQWGKVIKETGVTID